MRANRPALPYGLLIIGISILYLLGSWIFLFSLSLPSTREGLITLQVAQHQLLHDNAAAAQSFSEAGSHFETTSTKLQHSPFLIKVITFLPPFRWHVRLLRATHSLSEAGQEASGLSQSFPSLLPPNVSDVSSLLNTSSSTYLEWYLKNQTELESLNDHLATADQELQDVPAWIMLGQSEQLQTLKNQVHSLHSQVSLALELTEQVSQAMGRDDTKNHSVIILLDDTKGGYPFGQATKNFVVITGSHGHFDKLDIQPAAIPSQTVHEPFFPTAASQLSSAYQSTTSGEIEGILRIDPTVFQALLAQTGPIQLPVHATTVSTKTEPTTLFSTATLAELLPQLVNATAELPTEYLGQVFRDAFARKSLQIWAQQPALEDILSAAQPFDRPPSQVNWLKVITESGHQAVSFNQKVSIGSRVTCTVRVDGMTQKAFIIIPSQAETITSSQSITISVNPNWKEVIVDAPASISYTLPANSATRNHLLYLTQAGGTNQTLKAYNFTGQINGNTSINK